MLVISCFESVNVLQPNMDVLRKLNQESGSGKPYRGYPKLNLGFHEIHNFRESTGKYGKSIIVELNDQIVFLPSFIGEKIEEADITALNACKEKLFLFFGGRHEFKK